MQRIHLECVIHPMNVPMQEDEHIHRFNKNLLELVLKAAKYNGYLEGLIDTLNSRPVECYGSHLSCYQKLVKEYKDHRRKENEQGILEIPDDRVTRFINSLPNLSLVDRLPERNVSHVINQQPIQPAKIHTGQQPIQPAQTYTVQQPIQLAQIHTVQQPIQPTQIHTVQQPIHQTQLHTVQQPIQPAQIHTVQPPPMYMMYHPQTGYQVPPLPPATLPPQLTRYDQMPPIYPASYIRNNNNNNANNTIHSTVGAPPSLVPTVEAPIRARNHLQRTTSVPTTYGSINRMNDSTGTAPIRHFNNAPQLITNSTHQTSMRSTHPLRHPDRVQRTQSEPYPTNPNYAGAELTTNTNNNPQSVDVDILSGLPMYKDSIQTELNILFESKNQNEVVKFLTRYISSHLTLHKVTEIELYQKLKNRFFSIPPIRKKLTTFSDMDREEGNLRAFFENTLDRINQAKNPIPQSVPQPAPTEPTNTRCEGVSIKKEVDAPTTELIIPKSSLSIEPTNIPITDPCLPEPSTAVPSPCTADPLSVETSNTDSPSLPEPAYTDPPSPEIAFPSLPEPSVIDPCSPEPHVTDPRSPEPFIAGPSLPVPYTPYPPDPQSLEFSNTDSSLPEPITSEAPSPASEPIVEASPSPASEQTVEPSPFPASEPIAEPSPSPASEPIVEPSTSPAFKPIVEPSPSPAPKLIVEPSPSPASEQIVEPSPSPASELIVEPSPSPASEPIVEPSPPPASEPIIEPSPSSASEPIVEASPSFASEPIVEPSPSPACEPIVEPSPSPAFEPNVETSPSPASEPIVEPSPLPVPEPTVEPSPLPASEPIVEPSPSPASEPIVEPSPSPASEPIVELSPSPASEPIVDPSPLPVPEPTVEPSPPPAPEPIFPPSPINDSVFMRELSNLHESTTYVGKNLVLEDASDKGEVFFNKKPRTEDTNYTQQLSEFQKEVGRQVLAMLSAPRNVKPLPTPSIEVPLLPNEESDEDECNNLTFYKQLSVPVLNIDSDDDSDDDCVITYTSGPSLPKPTSKPLRRTTSQPLPQPKTTITATTTTNSTKRKCIVDNDDDNEDNKENDDDDDDDDYDYDVDTDKKDDVNDEDDDDDDNDDFIRILSGDGTPINLEGVNIYPRVVINDWFSNSRGRQESNVKLPHYISLKKNKKKKNKFLLKNFIKHPPSKKRKVDTSYFAEISDDEELKSNKFTKPVSKNQELIQKIERYPLAEKQKVLNPSPVNDLISYPYFAIHSKVFHQKGSDKNNNFSGINPKKLQMVRNMCRVMTQSM